MPVVRRRGKRGVNGGSKGGDAASAVRKVLGGMVRDGSDSWYVDVVGTRDGPMVRVRLVSEGEEVVSAVLDPKVASALALHIAHAAYMAARLSAGELNALWSAIRGGGGTAKRSEEGAEEPGPEEDMGLDEEMKIEDEVMA